MGAPASTTRAAGRATSTTAGALFPPPGFPAGGFGDTRRRALPVPAPIRAPFAHDDEAGSPARRGTLAAAAHDLAALVAVSLFVGAIVVALAGLTGV